jgi:hypothetical protein
MLLLAPWPGVVHYRGEDESRSGATAS